MRPRACMAGVFAIAGAAACHGSGGPAFVGASILAPSSEAEAAHDELLRADLGRADSAAREGIARGIVSSFAEDVIYLRGGLPIMRGRGAAAAVAAADVPSEHVTVRWQPVRAETSDDRKYGYSYGYTIYSSTQGSAAPSLRVDRYIAFWRREGATWQIAAYAETYGVPPTPFAIPAEFGMSVLADVPMSRTKTPVDALRSADEDFSRDAEKLGTGEAFGRYAAETAQIFSAPGEFVTGPDAITASFGGPAERSKLVWHPVEGEIARSGDLGFTVGNATFTGEREGGASIVRYSKYLTIWKRQRDGRWRYVVDGGSARPGS